MNTNRENLDEFLPQTEKSIRRLQELWQYVEALPTSVKQQLHQVIADHDINLQEMQVVLAELHCQNEELNTTHQLIAAERQRYQDLFEFAPDGYLVTDPYGVIREANQAAANLLSCSQASLAGKPLVVFVSVDTRSNFRQQLNQLTSDKKKVQEWEVMIQPRQGACFSATIKATAVQDLQKKKIGLCWVIRDISERKQHEAALKSAQSNLEKQVEERTVAVLASNQQLKAEIAERQRVELALQQLNVDLERQAQERTAQLQKSLDFEAMLKRITDYVRDSLDEGQILQTAVRELALGLGIDCCNTGLYNAERNTSTIEYEYSVNMPSAQGYLVEMADFPNGYRQLLQGEYFQFCELVPTINYSVAILACPIFDGEQVFGDLWLFKQPNEVFSELEIRLVQQVANQCAIAIRQARLYQTAQKQVAEQTKLNQLKDDFLSTVSHELRTPLSNMKMAIQMLALALNRDQPLFSELAKPTLEQGKVARYFQILHNECERESNLINNLLDLQRLYAGVQPLVLTSIQLQDWLPQVVEPFQARAQNSKLSLSVDTSPQIPNLVCDANSLERVLTELLDNAFKYTPLGENIVVAAQAQSGMMQLSVSNSGVEITAGELNHIFDKFYRVPNADPWKQGGIGLGLALVQQLVTHMEGKIYVESSANQTIFRVELPLETVKGKGAREQGSGE